MPVTFPHLHVHSAFSFLDSSSSVKDLVLRAAELGLPALALTDTNSITGIPSFVKACGKAGIKPVGGCSVSVDGHDLVLLAARVKLLDIEDNMDMTRLSMLAEKDLARLQKYHAARLRLLHYR